ncbi:putative dash complex subunit dad2 protein [Venturia nashicola]|nr:putative dash complex subunit dad2 protein [Venturia nashicola]
MSHYNPPTYTSSRPPPSHIRSGSSSTQASPVLLSRINDKKAELASLKELQTLSKALADQMEQLEEKLGTLSDGTEAVAAVLSNWHNVLRAISMASSALPKPKEGEDEVETPMPQTLVRIPTHQAGLLNQEIVEANSGGPE